MRHTVTPGRLPDGRPHRFGPGDVRWLGMGSVRGKGSLRPSRRAVLTASVTAAVGVAASRLAGLRAFDERVAGAQASKLLGMSAPSAPPELSIAMDAPPIPLGALPPELPLPSP